MHIQHISDYLWSDLVYREIREKTQNIFESKWDTKSPFEPKDVDAVTWSDRNNIKNFWGCPFTSLKTLLNPNQKIKQNDLLNDEIYSLNLIDLSYIVVNTQFKVYLSRPKLFSVFRSTSFSNLCSSFLIVTQKNGNFFQSKFFLRRK